MHRAISRTFLIAVPIYIIFAIIDWSDFHEDPQKHVFQVLLIRGAAVAIFVALLILSRRSLGRRHPYIIACTGYVVSALSLVAIMIRTREIPDNAEGFGLIPFLFCLLVPVSPVRATAMCAGLVGTYLIPAFYFSHTQRLNWGGITILIISTFAGLGKSWWDQKHARAYHSSAPRP
jgi:hypothetical protein